MPTVFKIFIDIVFMGILGYFTFWSTNKLLTVDGFEEKINDLKFILKLRKKQNRF